MHAVWIIVVCVVIVCWLTANFKRRDAAARAEGLAPLSHAQLKAARKAARTGELYKPQRRAYSTAIPYKKGRKQY